MLPSIKSALLFDTFTDSDGMEYIAVYKGDVLTWEAQGQTAKASKASKSAKASTKNKPWWLGGGSKSGKYPSEPASSVEVDTVMQGNDGNSYIATYDKKGNMVWSRYQTKLTDVSCVVTYTQADFGDLDCVRS